MSEAAAGLTYLFGDEEARLISLPLSLGVSVRGQEARERARVSWAALQFPRRQGAATVLGETVSNLQLASTTSGRLTALGGAAGDYSLVITTSGEVIVSETLTLRLIAQTATTITLGWDPVPGAVGYRFTREGYTHPDGSPRWSHTWNGALDRVKFAAGSDWYRVEALAIPTADTYP